LQSQVGCGLGRRLPRKRPPAKACREAEKGPPAVDLLTEIGKTRQNPHHSVVSAADKSNTLFLNNIILFKYCTEMKITLPDGHLGVSGGAYSQSYPQNLWVMNFLFHSNSLRAYAKVFSSIGWQAPEPA
jgi:hypothetical protein